MKLSKSFKYHSSDIVQGIQIWRLGWSLSFLGHIQTVCVQALCQHCMCTLLLCLAAFDCSLQQALEAKVDKKNFNYCLQKRDY